MTPDEEFKQLNAKVLDGSVREEERQRWEKLRVELQESAQIEGDGRRHQRSAIAIEVSFANEADLIRAVSTDLGAGGLALAVDGTFEVGGEHQLALTLAGTDAPVDVGARVVWARGGHVGFEFIDLPTALRDRIDALVWEEVDLSDL